MPASEVLEIIRTLIMFGILTTETILYAVVELCEGNQDKAELVFILMERENRQYTYFLN